MKKGIKSIISGGAFRKTAAACIALMMMITLMPSMGIAGQIFYEITYCPNAPGSQAPIKEYTTKGAKYNVKANSFSNPGYMFINWNTRADGSGQSFSPGQIVTVNANHTVYAQWKVAPADIIIDYMEITYKANAGDSQADVRDYPYKGSSYTVRANPFTRLGYTFTGWNMKTDGAGQSFSPGQIIKVNANYTVYAQWKVSQVEKVNITYKANAVNSQADILDTVNKGSSYTVRVNLFTRSGYTFTGWNTNANGSGTSFSPGQIVTVNANHTVYAQWKIAPVEKVAITYKANAGNSQADIKDTINKGSSYTVRGNSFTRSGYTFTGWNTNANGTGAAFSPGQVVTVYANNTVYAQWQESVIADVPTAVDGRILTAAKAGDSSDWIEIARNGKYSLLIRRLSVYYDFFGNTKAYNSSNVRKYINDFFNSSSTVPMQPLPNNANLRRYTVKNNALSKLGTSCEIASLYDGYSKPTGEYAIAGDDVCFALSWCEAVNLCSETREMNRIITTNILTNSTIAARNYAKLHQPNANIWLRSPGMGSTMAACLFGYVIRSGVQYTGTVFQHDISYGRQLMYPAVWVDSAVFN
jgi:uncharacterized repeat protein (TIGR02543 family)